jgi:protein gp37
MPTKIEWTRGDDGSPGETWNPTRGCSMAPGSELGGCLNCYAARNQLRRPNQTAASGKPFAILRDSGPRWSGEVELVELKVSEPLHWKQPRRVFVDSMSDLFHEALPDAAIDRVFAVMALCPQHTFQVLTKRADRMRQYFADIPYRQEVIGIHAELWSGLDRHFDGPGTTMGYGVTWKLPLPNVWLGVSVEDQATKYRIDILRQTPAAVRFISIEPLLEDIGQLDLTGIHWGIVGGESGPQARPCDLAWIESTVNQFQAAGRPLFVKQVGSKPVRSASGCLTTRYPITDSKGGNWDEWPERIRIREFPR